MWYLKYYFSKLCLQYKVAAILIIVFWNFTMFQNRSISIQVKRNLISSITNLVYKLPNQFPSDLRLKILGNQKIIEKLKVLVETQLTAHSSFQKLNFGNSSQKLRKSRYQIFLVLSSFTGNLYFVLNILLGIVVTQQRSLF